VGLSIRPGKKKKKKKKVQLGSGPKGVGLAQGPTRLSLASRVSSACGSGPRAG
jgi:hypothetical protein